MRISIFASCLIADPPAYKTYWYRLPHTMLYEFLSDWMLWILCGMRFFWLGCFGFFAGFFGSHNYYIMQYTYSTLRFSLFTSIFFIWLSFFVPRVLVSPSLSALATRSPSGHSSLRRRRSLGRDSRPRGGRSPTIYSDYDLLQCCVGKF